MNIKWNLRFLEVAKLISTFSKDPSTCTGGVIVRPDKTVASVGFNGFPRKIADKLELLLNREEKYKRIIHAEMNAILNAYGPVKGYTLYNWPGQSCARCAVHIIQAGIIRVVYPENSHTDFGIRWREETEMANSLFKEAEIEVLSIEGLL